MRRKLSNTNNPGRLLKTHTSHTITHRMLGTAVVGFRVRVPEKRGESAYKVATGLHAESHVLQCAVCMIIRLCVKYPNRRLVLQQFPEHRANTPHYNHYEYGKCLLGEDSGQIQSVEGSKQKQRACLPWLRKRTKRYDNTDTCVQG